MTLLELKNRLFELYPEQINDWVQDVYLEYVHCGFRKDDGIDKGFFWSNSDLENIDQTLLEDQDLGTQENIFKYLN